MIKKIIINIDVSSIVENYLKFEVSLCPFLVYK